MNNLRTNHRTRRRGITLTEVIVSCTLLASSMTVVIPMTFRLAHVRRTTHEGQLAQQELANQMDFLTALPREQLQSAAAQVKLHPSTAQQLADAQLTASVTKGVPDPSDAGRRIQLELTWTNSLGHPMAPRRLTSWVYPPGEDRTVTPPAVEDSP